MKAKIQARKKKEEGISQVDEESKADKQP